MKTLLAFLFLLVLTAIPAAGQGQQGPVVAPDARIGDLTAWKLHESYWSPGSPYFIEVFSERAHPEWRAIVVRERGELKVVFVRMGDVCAMGAQSVESPRVVYEWSTCAEYNKFKALLDQFDGARRERPRMRARPDTRVT